MASLESFLELLALFFSQNGLDGLACAQEFFSGSGEKLVGNGLHAGLAALQNGGNLVALSGGEFEILGHPTTNAADLFFG
jgi:hypothetical protein